MTNIRIEMKIAFEYPLDPEETSQTPEEALADTISYAKNYPMDYLDAFLKHEWEVTGSVIPEPPKED